MVHGEGAKDQTMDSLIKRFWFIHRSNEWLALHLARKILCVNGNIIRRLETVYPSVAAKAEVMTVSVDTQLFAPQPFPAWDGVFKVVFAGRLDSFKDPPLMFRMLAALRDAARRKGGVPLPRHHRPEPLSRFRCRLRTSPSVTASSPHRTWPASWPAATPGS